MTDKNILVLYHGGGCSDGFGAAYAAWCKFKNTADYLPVNYGDSPPDVTGKEVYILDFSYKRDVLIAMHAQAKSLLVLDHHLSAQQDLAGLDFAIFDMNRSGCVMAWEHFIPQGLIPLGLRLIQDRDLWRFKYPQTKAYTAALRALVPQTFEKWHTEVFFDLQAQDLANRGEDLLEVFDKDVAEIAKHKHKIVLRGIEGLACNAPSKYASELGNVLAKESGSFGAVYSYDGASAQWMYSLRSVGAFDVSIIAKHWGGGGHKNAAGFSSIFLTGFDRTERHV